MKRREFLSLLGGAAAVWPLAARAQEPERMRLIGVILPAAADDAVFQARVGAFLQALALLGWTVGRNVRIDTRWATPNAAEIRRHAAELAALAPDVILAHGASTVGPLLQATRDAALASEASSQRGDSRVRAHSASEDARKRAGGTHPETGSSARAVPIVFPVVADPVGAGIVDSLARPGGNATGFMTFEYSIGGKRLELLKQIAPGVTRAAVLRDPTQGSGTSQFAAIQAVAPSLRVEVNPVNVRDSGEIERAVAAFARAALASGASGQRGDSIVRAHSASEDARKRADDTRPEPGSSARAPNGGLIVTAGAGAERHRDLIITLAARHKLPAVYSDRVFVAAGGLVSYGPDQIDQYRRAAGYVDRILRGEKPGDLPVQAPTKYELVINLKTAKALGMTVPQSVLARADEVIE